MSETLQGLILVVIFALVNWGLFLYRDKIEYKKRTYYALVSQDDFMESEKGDQ